MAAEKPYRFLYPMRVVLITSKYGDRENVMAAAWCFPVSMEPPLFAVSVSRKRFSHELISKGRAFAINLVDAKIREKAVAAGRSSGKDRDKFAELSIAREYGKLGMPLVKDSPASIECKLVKEIELGDHVLFVGGAVNIIERRKAKGLYHAGGDDFVEI
ncbi:MAG: flavin reductase family protein [Candidatus ainarchaeum sp.]|nr:flavin reductase family protein [Candidatus ainarchaeum sp.]